MTRTAADWTRPGAHEVAPGVLRVPLSMPGDGLRAVNVYLVETGPGLALVDAGWRVPTALPELRAALAAVGRRVEDVADVYVTHIHRDHYTLAPELRRRVGTRVHLGRGERPGLHAVRELGSNVPVSSLRELARAGAGAVADAVRPVTAAEPFDAADWEDPDGWLDPGPLDVGGRAWTAVATPGHTKGHLVFHDAEHGVMLTGDHVLPTITPSIGFELGDWDRPLGEYLGSLARLLDLPDAAMLPAHGPAGGSVHVRVRELLAHHEQRLAEIRRVVDGAVRAGRPATGLEVAARLPWTRRARAFADLDDFNQMIAVCETLAHLDVLVDRGALTRRELRPPVEAFSPVG